MRIAFTAAACLFLAGCAHDNYTAMSGSAPTVSESKAAWDCHYDVYYHWNMQRDQSGALAAGVVGGAVGGLAVGLLDADSWPMKASDLGPAIAACMASKGYVGTREN